MLEFGDMIPQTNGNLCCDKKIPNAFLSVRYRVARASGAKSVVKNGRVLE